MFDFFWSPGKFDTLFGFKGCVLFAPEPLGIFLGKYFTKLSTIVYTLTSFILICFEFHLVHSLMLLHSSLNTFLICQLF